MKNKLFFGLLISFLAFVFITQNSILVVEASSLCKECIEDELYAYQKIEVKVDVSAKPIIIIDDDNDEGITLLGDENGDIFETNAKPIVIVDDDNDEGITLLGDDVGNGETK